LNTAWQAHSAFECRWSNRHDRSEILAGKKLQNCILKSVNKLQKEVPEQVGLHVSIETYLCLINCLQTRNKHDNLFILIDIMTYLPRADCEILSRQNRPELSFNTGGGVGLYIVGMTGYSSK
jgi:hypothetical protein